MTNRSNLAARTDAFIGRARELEAIEAAFRERARLVTLVGAGGIGKTRLALEFALAEEPAAERWLVSLSQVRSLDALLAAVAGALGVQLSAEEPGVEQLGRDLAERGDVLLILDNLEQVIDEAASVLSAWRAAASQARFLVTSRAAVRLGGERRIELPPLTPDDSVTLFCERARSLDHRFSLNQGERVLLAQLAERLDGIPLAIELAAARSRAMPIAALGERLGASLSLLRSNRRDVEPRQATLSATIDWSWQLLPPDEQGALAQCGVFRDGFSLAAAEAVVTAEPGGTPVVDLMQALCDKSLVRCERVSAGLRYRLYEPIREFAEGRLVDAWASPHSVDT